MVSLPRIWLFADFNQAESRIVAWKGPVPKLKQWYQAGVDVHSYVAKLVAKVIQENKIQTPVSHITGKQLFWWKAPDEFGKDEFGRSDEEREGCKRGIHAYDYGMGADKLALILNIPVEFATVILKIIGALFPEIKTNYHAWVEASLKRNRTIVMPEPVAFRKVFWDDVSKPDVIRSAYSCYPQCTIGSMLKRTISRVTKIFKEDQNEIYKDHWCAWYGKANWDHWRKLRDDDARTPQALRWSGMDVRLNVHDAGGISIPDDSWLLLWAASCWKDVAETPIQISPKESVVIPVDFKIGKTWGAEDLKDYKIVV